MTLALGNRIRKMENELLRKWLVVHFSCSLEVSLNKKEKEKKKLI